MRDQNGRFLKGTSGNVKGRPKRADEQVLIDLWESEGQTQLSKAVKNGERWAIKLLVDKIFANKKDISTDIGFQDNIKIELIKYS